MAHAIAARFIDEAGIIREGEIINPAKIVGHPTAPAVEVEFHGDNMVAIMTPRSNGSLSIFYAHASRISAMYPSQGLPLLPIKRDLAIFDQDAED